MTLSIWDAARKAPDRAALIAGSSTLSYAELAAGAGRALGWLKTRTFRGPVAMVPESDVPSVAMLHALIGAGIPALLVHPRLTAGERVALLAEAGADLMVDPEWWQQPVTDSRPSEPVPDDERPLSILFTSGTTRRPKGVLLSRRAFVAAARASRENLGDEPEDRWLLCLPLAHVGGLSVLTRCLLARRCVVLARPRDGEVRVAPDRIAELIDEHRVSLVSLVPTQLAAMLELSPRWQPPAQLRAVLLGGAAASSALLARAAERGWPILTTYGLTEACSQVATQRLGTVNRGELGVGRAVSGVELRIVDGTIRIRGPTLFSGYFRAAEPALDADGWFDTGDLGRIDDTGALHVLGRRDELIVTGGENVSPADVEAVLESHPALSEVCVFGLPDPVWGELVAAAVVPRPDQTPSLEELGRWASERLAAYKLPRRWALLSELPRHPSGKLDRARAAAAALPGLRDVQTAAKSLA
jgi:o-succinylbenzoate---CoA ligase